MLQYHSLRIIDKRPETERAVVLTFEVPDAVRSHFRFVAGQHLGLKIMVNGEELRRTYSISSAPDDPALCICVRLVPGGRLSQYVAEHLRVGERIDVLMPNGSFRAAAATGNPRTCVAFAAGIGITPIISIVSHLLASDPKCQVLLFCGNRNVDAVLFTEELQALKDRYVTRLALHFLMTSESQGIDLYNGRLDAAKLDAMVPALFETERVDEFFICGPGSMIADLTTALTARGVAAARIHSEHFLVAGAQTAIAASPAATKGAASGQKRTDHTTSGQVRVAVLIDGRTRSFEMPMDGTSVLDAAAAAGLDLPFSCRAGVCSTCRTRLVKGKVEMHTNYALEQRELEEGFILACQAHPVTSELELTYDSR